MQSDLVQWRVSVPRAYTIGALSPANASPAWARPTKEHGVSDSLENWQPRPRPSRETLEGRYVRLEPLDPAAHGDELYAASSVPDAAERFAWLFEYPPESRAAFQPWLERMAASEDPLVFAVIDKASGTVAGRQTLMRIDPTHGVIEIGSIYWGPAISRRPAATEAQYLFMKYAFETLGYRRYEWKCNDRNGPSKRAAERFGFKFEGLFRNHMVAKGENRDTAWFSIIDSEWPALKQAYEAWLEPANFDADGLQKRRLEEVRAQFGA
jgi:RimJ/RimL family protein N-acetyltransferase